MNSGRSAIKIILVMGVGAFLLLALISFGLRRSLEPNPLEKVKIRQKYSPFDANRAMEDLRRIVDFGPRLPASEASKQTLGYLSAELKKAGLRVWEQPFEATGPEGPVAMTNLVAEVDGSRPGIILFANHYDTTNVPGANDGGSTTAWMLEWARALGPRREGRGVWLAWFDGSEPLESGAATTGLAGSRALAGLLKERGDLKQVQAMIDLEMIGDCYLGLQADEGTPAWLAGMVWDTAERLRYGRHFSPLKRPFDGDHVAFREAGIPAMLLVDPVYGGSILDHEKNWHTSQDTLEKVCPESLQAVADVLYHALPAIDGRLETLGTPPHSLPPPQGGVD